MSLQQREISLRSTYFSPKNWILIRIIALVNLSSSPLNTGHFQQDMWPNFCQWNQDLHMSRKKSKKWEFYRYICYKIIQWNIQVEIQRKIDGEMPFQKCEVAVSNSLTYFQNCNYAHIIMQSKVVEDIKSHYNIII